MCRRSIGGLPPRWKKSHRLSCHPNLQKLPFAQARPSACEEGVCTVGYIQYVALCAQGKKSRHACTRNIPRLPATHTRAQGMLCQSVPDKPTFVVERTKYMKTKCTARTRAMMLLAVRTEAVPKGVWKSNHSNILEETRSENSKKERKKESQSHLRIDPAAHLVRCQIYSNTRFIIGISISVVDFSRLIQGNVVGFVRCRNRLKCYSHFIKNSTVISMHRRSVQITCMALVCLLAFTPSVRACILVVRQRCNQLLLSCNSLTVRPAHSLPLLCISLAGETRG